MLDKTMEARSANKAHVFRNRNFALLFWGILVSNVAHILFSFAISYFILEISSTTYGEATATLIQSAYLAVNSIILLVLTPLGGVLADRWNKAKIMYVTDFIRGGTILLSGAFVFLTPTLTGDLIALFAMNVVLSVNAGIFGPASSSLLRFIVADHEIQQASSYLQGSANFQSIIGLILCGIVYANVDMIWIFVLNGMAYLISAFTELFIRYEPKISTEKIRLRTVLSDSKDGLKYLFGQKAVLLILVMALFLNFFFNPIFAVGFPNFIQFRLANEPQYLFQAFLSPTAWVAAIEIIFSIAAIVMAMIISSRPPREKQGKRLKFTLGALSLPALVIAVTLVLYYQDRLGIDPTLLIIAGSMFLLGLGNVAFNIPVSVIMQQRVDKAMLGKVSSVSNVISMGLIPFSSLLGGLIISKISPSALYVVCAAGMVLVSTWYILHPRANEI